MLTWSESPETGLGGSPIELDEGILFHTLKGVDPVDDPFIDLSFTVVPVPAAVWLFASGLIGLLGISTRRKAWFLIKVT